MVIDRILTFPRVGKALTGSPNWQVHTELRSSEQSRNSKSAKCQLSPNENWRKKKKNTQTNKRLCQLERFLTQSGHTGMGPTGMGPTAIFRIRASEVDGFMVWLLGEPLIPSLLLAPHPGRRETGRFTGKLGLSYL